MWLTDLHVTITKVAWRAVTEAEETPSCAADPWLRVWIAPMPTKFFCPSGIDELAPDA